MSFVDETMPWRKCAVDGIIFECDERRATFLPQVWEQLPQPPTVPGSSSAEGRATTRILERRSQAVRFYGVEKWKED